MGNARRPTHAGLFHVTTRSVAEERIFATDEDYVDGVHQLARLAGDGSMRCHAFCLMPTHYHVLASFEENGLAATVHRLNRRYASGFNRRHNRRGHVFDSPYRAVEVTDERHLIVLAAYLAHNPGSRLDWPWSSYAGTVGAAPPFGFVDPEPLVVAFADRVRLRDFVQAWKPTPADLGLLSGRQAVTRVPGSA